MKKNCLAICIGIFSGLSAQVGINTATPNSTLSINGSIQAGYKEITSSTYDLTISDHYVTYNGNTDALFTLPPVGSGTTSFSGRIYRLKNISPFNVTLGASNGNILRSDGSSALSLVIPNGAYVEVVNNNNTTGGTWDVSFFAFPKSGASLNYVTQVPIPPAASSFGVPDWTNHTNTDYDSGTASDVWWVVEKKTTLSSHTADLHRASRVTLIYEYQGLPFNLTSIYPFLTTVAPIPTVGVRNVNSLQGDYDVLSASLVNLENDAVSGKTKLTVTVALVSEVNPSSDFWSDSLLNVSLLKKGN
ncbi:hypothetical protein [Chryseobacterium sp. M5A1_1a]